IKFTPENGVVRVRVCHADRAVEVCVTDTGQGIPAEFVRSVFEPFRQADASSTRAHGGLGLGLAIVKHLVEAHGGTVSAESGGADRGAAFTVRLPLSDIQNESAEVAEDRSNEGDAGRNGQDVISLHGLTVLI